ncbi:hypothetical protein DM02DRAFT_655717 [Periconia macrospinosa]|uniref:Uncharacterized protein n=1 Tax=Periconia macrospinosa TaxID=97972 RepID=A0A2V1DPS1_9PLEO|nr:hypothetical protein DM02DRAFT_655717 [Periconia macrospinosa]
MSGVSNVPGIQNNRMLLSWLLKVESHVKSLKDIPVHEAAKHLPPGGYFEIACRSNFWEMNQDDARGNFVLSCLRSILNEVLPAEWRSNSMGAIQIREKRDPRSALYNEEETGRKCVGWKEQYEQGLMEEKDCYVRINDFEGRLICPSEWEEEWQVDGHDSD